MRSLTKIFLALLLVAPVWAQIESKITRDLTVLVKVDPSALPTDGKLGTDVMISKKGESKSVVSMSKHSATNNGGLEIPFVFRNIPSVGFNDELTIRAYSSSYNIKEAKWVGMKSVKVKRGVRKITLEMDLEEVTSDVSDPSASAND